MSGGVEVLSSGPKARLPSRLVGTLGQLESRDLRSENQGGTNGPANRIFTQLRPGTHKRNERNKSRRRSKIQNLNDIIFRIKQERRCGTNPEQEGGEEGRWVEV